MGTAIGRWLKHGSRQVYSESFATKEGALRIARAEARRRGANWEAGEPFHWGSG